MTGEHSVLLGVPPTTEVTQLVTDIAGAALRSTKAEPGDRSEVERFESLATQLESHADSHHITAVPVSPSKGATILFGADEAIWGADLDENTRAEARTLVASGLVPVLRTYALQPRAGGSQDDPATWAGVPNVADTFDAGGEVGRAAVEARFRDQIGKSLAAAERGEILAISPSGIQNPVVTEILRANVGGFRRTDVPVAYRDGSRSEHPFPLRSLALKDVEKITGAYDLTLRFALLSIRHTEMDAVVDGAWLRNAEVSRMRKQGQTDDLVYEMSRRQLDELTANGTRSVHMELCQTGLEPAVVGFYKALTYHLLAHPGTVAVGPLYFDSRTTKKSNDSPGRLVSSPFRQGTPWVM